MVIRKGLVGLLHPVSGRYLPDGWSRKCEDQLLQREGPHLPSLPSRGLASLRRGSLASRWQLPRFDCQLGICQVLEFGSLQIAPPIRIGPLVLFRQLEENCIKGSLFDVCMHGRLGRLGTGINCTRVVSTARVQ